MGITTAVGALAVSVYSVAAGSHCGYMHGSGGQRWKSGLRCTQWEGLAPSVYTAVRLPGGV